MTAFVAPVSVASPDTTPGATTDPASGRIRGASTVTGSQGTNPVGLVLPTTSTPPAYLDRPCKSCDHTFALHYAVDRRGWVGAPYCSGTYFDGYVIQELPCVCHGWVGPDE